jgi:hypothetical protein
MMNGREQLFHQPSTKLNPTLISFFVANHFSQIAFKSGKSAKDLAVAFIRRTTGSSLYGTLIIGFL